jgi:RHS repeat-associated protein
VDVSEVHDEAFTYLSACGHAQAGDVVGNRKTEAGVDDEWNYNENNELLTFADVEYVYGENGNMTHVTLDGTVVLTYTYDAADRMVQVDDVNGATIAEYYYDPFGRRLWKDVDGTRTYFFYSDEGLIGKYDETGTEIKTYGYKPDSTWTTDPLFLKQGGEYYFYQSDHLGTPQKLVGVNGAVVWSARYSAFGKSDVQVETVTNNLRFPGQYYDVETGLFYNWFRYYDPKIGRYLKGAPSGGSLTQNHLYAYVNDKPIATIDPNGLQLKEVVGVEIHMYRTQWGSILKPFIGKRPEEGPRYGHW